MSFENFSTGKRHSFGGIISKIQPYKFIQYVEEFDDPNLPGKMTTSVVLNKVSVGTEIKIVQENIPSVIPLEMCYLGWQESQLRFDQVLYLHFDRFGGHVAGDFGDLLRHRHL